MNTTIEHIEKKGLHNHLSVIKPNTHNELESQTIIHCVHMANPIYINGGWVNIHANTYLLNSEVNEKLVMEHALDIPLSPNKYYYTSKQGLKRFTLLFPAIPSSWKSFSLIEESGTENGFIVKNILRNNTGVYHLRIN